jgi:hypothetical protein
MALHTGQSLCIFEVDRLVWPIREAATAIAQHLSTRLPDSLLIKRVLTFMKQSWLWKSEQRDKWSFCLTR